jgi:1,4-alpha-glucan branching enzyme
MTKTKTKKQSKISGRKRVNFEVQANPESDVFVSGTFNNWNGDAKQMKDASGDGGYSISLMLPKGKHEYKFLIDGEWHVDLKCPNWKQNDYGTLNSVVSV